MKSFSNSLVTSFPILLIIFSLAIFSAGNPFESTIHLVAMLSILAFGLMTAFLTDKTHQNSEHREPKSEG
jgi:hypothetical protein